MFTFKIAICGFTSVGKTSLCNRLTNRTPDTDYVSTIGVDYKSECLENHNLKLCYWDLAGDCRFEAITYSYVKKVHIVLFVYDINDYQSVYRLKTLYNTYKKINWDGLSIVIGNMIDKKKTPNFINEGIVFANDIKSPHILVSAKSEEGILNLKTCIINTLKTEFNVPPPAPQAYKDQRVCCFDIFNITHTCSVL